MLYPEPLVSVISFQFVQESIFSRVAAKDHLFARFFYFFVLTPRVSKTIANREREREKKK